MQSLEKEDKIIIQPLSKHEGNKYMNKKMRIKVIVNIEQEKNVSQY